MAGVGTVNMKKFTVTIIGLGNITHGYEYNPNVRRRIQYPTHISAVGKDSRFKIIAACDISSKARQLFKKRIEKKIPVYNDYLKMVRENKSDLVVVASPTSTHFEVCEKLISHGVKYILCEKPVTQSLKQAQSLKKMADKNRVNISVNYYRSFDGSYLKLAQDIKDGVYGKIQTVNFKYTGGVFNTATHYIDLIQKIFGKIDTIYTIQSDAESDPNVTFFAKVKNINIYIEAVPKSKYRLVELDMTFDKSRIKIETDLMTVYNPVNDSNFVYLKEMKNKQRLGHGLKNVYENLYQVMTINKRSHCSLEDAISTLKVAEIAAMAKNKLVKI